MIEYIVQPLLGGVIGYITNEIAIRMLFRPHTAKYIMGLHIPFTPGLIPKEKGRIAKTIGEVISNNLMSEEVLKKYLLSDSMTGKVRSSVDRYFEKQKNNEETLEQFISHFLSQEDISTISSSVNEYLTCQIYQKLTNTELGKQIAHIAMEQVSRKLSRDGADDLMSSLGGALRTVLIGPLFDKLREPAENLLSQRINEMLCDNGRQMVSGLIGNEVRTFLDKKVCDLMSGLDDQLAKATDMVEAVYRNVIQEHLPNILSSLNIERIVEDRINEMDVNETEKLILKVMNKELKAIVWLGALLGLIMGSIMLFF